jgi:hypothetical protein
MMTSGDGRFWSHGAVPVLMRSGMKFVTASLILILIPTAALAAQESPPPPPFQFHDDCHRNARNRPRSSQRIGLANPRAQAHIFTMLDQGSEKTGVLSLKRFTDSAAAKGVRSCR